MIRTFSISLLAIAAGLSLALPAAAQDEPEPGEVFISGSPRGGWPVSEDTVVIADFRRPEVTPDPADDFIVVADLRLPTLGDLSKERWNQVHRRYDSGKGRREKIRA